jgi:DNA-binding response OmpR family regulator
MPKQKILIAEDSKIERELYEQVLLGSIFDKVIVSDGEAALKSYQEWEPDIVLLDINMPLMNGFQVLKAIRDKHNDKKTTIIMATSSSDKADVVACAKYGIQGYMVKPFMFGELNQVIMKFHNNNSTSV